MLGLTNWQYRNTVLVLCTLGFASTMVARVVISPVVPDITDGFGVSTAAVGLALTGMWAAYALAQFPSGVLGDRFGERRVILLAVGGTGLASLLLAASPSFALFALLAVTLGATAGMVYTAATSLVAKQAPETGRAIGVYISGGPLAGLLAPPVAAAVGAQFGWRTAIALGVATAIPVFLLFAWRVEPTPPPRPDRTVREQIDVDKLADLLTRPAILQATVLAVLGAFTWQATASFLPAFLEEFRGHSRTTTSLLFSGYFFVHGLTQPLTGTLSDRYSRTAAVTLTMTVGVVGYGLLVLGSSLASAVLAAALVGLAMSWGAPLQSQFMDALSDEERGTGFGLVRTAYMVLGALGSVVTGAVPDLAGWAVAFGMLAGLMAVGLTILLFGSAASRIKQSDTIV